MTQKKKKLPIKYHARKSNQVVVRMKDDLTDSLDEYAVSRRITRSEAARVLLRAALRRKARLAARRAEREAAAQELAS